MPTEELYVGAKFTVKVWVENDACEVLDFLDELNANGNSDYERLYYLIEKMANTGVIRNERHVRRLEDGIFEFKAPKTGRILFFYDKGRLIICSHGFTGKKGNAKKFIARQIKKAVEIKEKYFDEKGEKK